MRLRYTMRAIQPMAYAMALAASFAFAHQTSAQARSVVLSIDGRASANPSITARGRYVALSWSAATVNAMDVFAALSSDGGATFSAPVRVNSMAGDARVNSELPPRVALVPKANKPNDTPDVVVVWTTKAATGTRLLSARSTDGAQRFGASSVVPGSDGPGSRGWQSVAVDSTGQVDVLWLDHRETATAAPMQHNHSDTAAKTPATNTLKPDPTERAQLSKLYFSSLNRSSAVEITGGVCFCCKTSLTTAGKNVYGVWRHVFAGSHRDIAFTMSSNGGQTFTAPVRVSSDNWEIDGCPENGPAVAVDAARHVHVVWPTPPDGKTGTPLGLFYATSRDAKQFSPRVQIPTRGPAAHVQMALDASGAPVITWDEIVNSERRLAMVRVRTDANGRVTFVPLASLDARADNGWPVIATTQSGLVSAWVSGSGTTSKIRVTTLR